MPEIVIFSCVCHNCVVAVQVYLHDSSSSGARSAFLAHHTEIVIFSCVCDNCVVAVQVYLHDSSSSGARSAFLAHHTEIVIFSCVCDNCVVAVQVDLHDSSSSGARSAFLAHHTGISESRYISNNRPCGHRRQCLPSDLCKLICTNSDRVTGGCALR